MDPSGVRAVGDGVGRLAGPAQAVADALDGLPVPRPVGEAGIGPEVADALAVWGDGVRALSTELGLLADRCLQSAHGVRAEDDAARAGYRRPTTSPLRKGRS